MNEIQIGRGSIALSHFELPLDKFLKLPTVFKKGLLPSKSIDEIDVILTEMYNTVNKVKDVSTSVVEQTKPVSKRRTTKTT